MKYLKVKKYILTLFREGTKWEYKEILETKKEETTPDKVKRLTRRKRIVLLVVAIPLGLMLNVGFNKDFIGYVIAALSIFIGLFTNLIIALYQRSSTLPKVELDFVNDENSNDTQKTNVIKVRNFILQFTFVTGKNLLISTLIIFLATATLLFETFFKTDIFNYEFVTSIKEVNFQTLQNFFSVSSLIIYRTSLVYLLIDFFILLLYSLGALFTFLKVEYSDNKV